MRTPMLPCLPVLGLLALAGCPSTQDPERAEGEAPAISTPEAASGSRLRVKLVEGGGVRQAIGFFDTARNEECSFQLAADGRYRCLPRLVLGAAGGVFADASCTIPSAIFGVCSDELKYVAYVEPQTGCVPFPSGPRIASLRPVVRTATASYIATGGACVVQPLGPNARSVELGDEISLDDFVAAIETTVRLGDVSEKVLVATDGTRQHLGFRIDSMDVDCTFESMDDGVARCVPPVPIAQILYRDAACKDGALAVGGSPGGCTTTESLLVRERSGGACPTLHALHRIVSGDVLPDGSFYTWSASGSSPSSALTCEETSSRSSFLPARPIEDITDTLPKSERIGRGAGRLVPALVSAPTPTGATLVRGWHDTQKDIDCSFAKAADGKIRCLPAAPSGVVFFTDSTCTSPERVGALSGPVSCAGAASRFIRVEESAGPTSTSGCAIAPPLSANAPVTRVYELTGPMRTVERASWASAPGRCSLIAAVNNASDIIEVDPSEFVEGTLRTE